MFGGFVLMAVQRKPTETAGKCQACGKPLYRPRTCRACGGVFCNEHVSARKHSCPVQAAKARRLPSRRILAIVATCTVVVICLGAAYVWWPRRGKPMAALGNRSLRIGPYLQYFREDLGRGDRLEGVEIRDMRVYSGEIWAATSEGLFRLKGSWKKEGQGLPEAGAWCLAADGNASLLAGFEGAAYVLEDGTWSLLGDGISDRKAMTLARDASGKIWLGTDRGIAVMEGGRWSWFQSTANLSVRALAATRGSMMAGTDRGLWMHSEGAWRNLTNRSGATGLLSADVRAAAVNELGDVWVCSGGGVDLFDGRDYYYSFSGENGLPYEDAQCVAFGLNGTVWIGTSFGLCELRDGRWHYYQGRRWTPNDDIRSLVVGPDGSVWLGTPDGVGKISGKWMTLEEKADLVNGIVQERHERDGYIDFIDLPAPGDFSSWTYDASDNDGLWTSIYLAAESFRYAVTGDPKAKQNAKECYDALKRLEQLTGIAGFPARAAVRRDSTNVAKSGGEWHQSTVDPSWEWKGDTSSDEVDGHYFAYAIYYDLVADDDEKRDVAALVQRITDHIIGHDYYLVDLDGKRTRWGVWNPREINDDPTWAEEHGLNALEILSHIKVAIHMTGQERFEAAYRELIDKYHYHLNTISQKILPPGSVNHSDDELAFLAYYPLLLYEDDPGLRAVYLKSIERSWQIERPERSPFFNFVYGSATQTDFDLEESVEELKGMSPDLLDWGVSNYQRSDVQARLAAGEVFTLPFENRNMRRWNANPYNLDWGGGGQSEGDGAYFLMPYWMGRYHGFIVEGD